jgi:DNA-directed RNA polymerase specialized sigma24 family protein
MEPGLTAEAFAKLLDRLGDDRAQAGEKYEDLRRTLIRFFQWRGAPFPEEQTDETFNRLARKLEAGIEIKNIGGYCYEVARLVFLESLKGHESRHAQLEEINLQAAVPDTTELLEKEQRLTCLDECLRALPDESRELISEYYRDKKRERIDHRKVLAERLGLRRDALANRAQRVRDKLEQCVTRCFKGLQGDSGGLKSFKEKSAI